jgi:signal transduction histidine kinase
MSVADRTPPLDPDAQDNVRLARRMRIAITLCIAPILLYAVFDLALLPYEDLAVYWGLKLAALAVIGVAAALLRQRRPYSRARLIVVGLTCVTAMYALSTTSSVLAGDAQTTAIMSLAVTLATATLLPWGIGAQLAVVAIGGVSTALAFYGAYGDLYGLVRYPTVGLVIGMGVSVYVAAEFDRSRKALTQRQQEQRRAEAEVRRLNGELETRVIERTAELERVNRELYCEIDERTRFAAELRQSQAAVSALIENASDAIWAIDRDGRMIVSNAAVRQRYQRAVGSELKTAEEYTAVVREHLATYWAPLYARGLAGERFHDEQTTEGPTGRRYFINAFNPIIIDGAVAGLAIFSSEVTELRRSEEATRQRQAELTHVQRLSTLGEMAAGLAHEINQPLAAIVNYARGCARRLRADPTSVAAVLPAVDSISTEALRAGEVIRRLRQLIRKETPRRETVDVNALVGESLRIVEPDARQAQVSIEEFLAPGLPAVVGDGIQIEQVVLNLLRNAVEAMTGAGERRVLQIVTRAADAGGVEVAIRDTGPGLPPGLSDAIFDPFVSTKAGGLGMGLSISRTIVESHHGRLWATANPEGGMTFRIELPGQDPVPEASMGRAVASDAPAEGAAVVCRGASPAEG